MNIAWIAAQQTMIMFLYMIAGAVLYKRGKLTQNGSRDLATLLLWLILPVVIIDSFCVQFSFRKMMEMGVSFLMGFLALILAMMVARFFFHKKPVDNFAAAFSNAGFIGIPLVRAVLGDEAVFYTVGIIAMLNILQWTYGVAVLTGERKYVSLKSIVMNPIFVGTFIGLLIFCTGMGDRIPKVLSSTFRGIAMLNAPLAMLVLGSYLAQTKPREMLSTLSLYKVSIIRLLLIPLLTLVLFSFMPCAKSIKMAVLCAAAAPVGVNVAVYAQLNDLNYPYACQTVVLSTVLSVISLPFILMAARIILI